MDIQKIISDLVAKLTGNKDLIAKFTADPIGAIKELLGIDIDKDQVSEVVKGVTSQLGCQGRQRHPAEDPGRLRQEIITDWNPRPV